MREILNLNKHLLPFTKIDILYCKAERNKSVIYFSKNEFRIINYTLLELEKFLKATNLFKRVHISYLVKIEFILNVDINAGFLKLKDSTTLPINKKYFN